ncbi:DUF6515 family protein [Cytophaga sp. FL35]|uniref:DUF6515 family protein n=1 Tax=Cytophaga sp. FL35 TaxID=1904456 RepID=UPI0016535E12|nr:DUF6515 family protein [Cytophaga sp. FL35]MBC6996863.1 hypothetical protein [Cytophaga sp. FL35]
MRNLKIVLLLALTFIIGNQSFANSTATSVEKEITRVSPRTTTKIIVFKGKKYQFKNGNWYITRGRKLVVVRPPIGIKVRTLPRTNRVVLVKGKKRYLSNGIYYKKRGRNFVVVKI